MDDLIKLLLHGVAGVGAPDYTETDRIMEEAADALERMQWNTDMEAAMDAGEVVLECYVNNERRVSTGGWDSHWTGKCWVYHDKVIPRGTPPSRWMRIPE